MYNFLAVRLHGHDIGSGIYTSDSISKVAEFCDATPADKTSYVFVPTAALGNIFQTNVPDDNLNPPANFNTIWGRGRKSVIHNWNFERSGTLSIPTGVLEELNEIEGPLEHNELIVRDKRQIYNEMFLAECKFIF
jgi:hypothetical protein